MRATLPIFTIYGDDNAPLSFSASPVRTTRSADIVESRRTHNRVASWFPGGAQFWGGAQFTSGYVLAMVRAEADLQLLNADLRAENADLAVGA